MWILLMGCVNWTVTRGPKMWKICVTSFMGGPQGEVSIPLGQAIAGAGAATIVKYKKYKQLLKLLKLLAPSIGQIGGAGGGKGQNT